MSSIKMEHIHKSYGDHQVLNDFTMHLEPGEFISVIGGSGSGKTTVLKLINGLLTPEQGTIYIEDKNIVDYNMNDLRRHIGYVIQSIGLFPHMNIHDNIAYVLNLQKIDSAIIENRIQELLRITGLDGDLLSRFPDEVSGGQKQRVGLARALAAKPTILLMDEPFSAVDEITRHALQDEIKQIHKELNLTIFFITHDIREALRLGDRVMVMKDGAIEQFAQPNILKQQPQTEFVKQLLSYL